MKTVILAGGYGTRISEETQVKPKPMVEIGEKPMLWHIMNLYAKHGFQEFIVCLGYKGYVIKEYFAHYHLHESDVTFDFSRPRGTILHRAAHPTPWKVTLADTGADTMTGGRIRRIRRYVGDEPFLLTYGDGLSDLDINALVRWHRSHGKLATVTATQPAGRFGALRLTGRGEVSAFREKPAGDGGWVNAGFFVMQPEVFDYLEDDETVLENEPLERLAGEGQLMAYRHRGFWQPMDTMRDKMLLESYWASGAVPWLNHERGRAP